MSLPGIRRERRRRAEGPFRPPQLWKLMLATVLVIFVIWYLSRLS